MITRLTIENIALVDKLSLNFDSGLSVLSGETGAGKSVIVTALSLILGGRAEKEFIRQGFDRASVEAEVDISSLSTRYKKDFSDYHSGGRLLIRRELSRDGKSRVRINNELSSITRLKELTGSIAEIVGQHASQMLMNEENHLSFLDHFAALKESTDSIAELFDAWDKTTRNLHTLVSRKEKLVTERELLLFQRKEIEEAEIRPGEEVELHRERRILDSSRELMTSAETIIEALDGEDISAIVLLRKATKELDKMAEVDQSLKEKASALGEADFLLSDMRQFIEQYASVIHDDPSRIEEINLRLDELYQLKNKYGGSEESILEALTDIKQQLADRPDVDARIEQLELQAEELRKTYTAEALAISEARKKAARYLRTLVLKELTELAIDNGGFEFEFEYVDDPEGVIIDGRAVRPFAHGLEQGRFLFSANPGEETQSLVKIASGGEISRVLLALKAAQNRQSSHTRQALVFDEVDAGIGGQTATEVGNKLKRLSEQRQVIVITHLHQIARFADHHYLATKCEKNGRSVIDVKRLDVGQRRLEIDRMVALPD